jgi:hypothetical protein
VFQVHKSTFYFSLHVFFPSLAKVRLLFHKSSMWAAHSVAALVISTSNADRLANYVATLRIVMETIITGGWVLTTDAVSEILPQVTAYCASLPAEAPVVIYCLDNSSFCCANSDRQLSAISKQKDSTFHVVGEIMVVHEVTLAAAVTNLKRIILDFGDRRVIIITLGPRYLTQPCCCRGGHCVHLLVPESGLKMMADLAHLHLFIQRRLCSSTNCLVIPACDLLSGKKGASLEEALAAFSTWGTVHGSTSSYTRMALALVDSHFGNTPPAAPVLPVPPSQHQKQQRAESNSSYESGSESRHPIPVLSSFRTSSLLPSLCGFSRGGSRWSGYRNPFRRGSKRGNFGDGLCFNVFVFKPRYSICLLRLYLITVVL